MIVLLMLAAAVLATPCADGDWFPVFMEGLAYPRLGTAAQLTGTVKLQVVVGEQGKVSTAEIISGHPLLARAAQENVKTWVFTRCCGSDRPTTSPSIEFTYVFKLEGVADYRPQTRFRYEHPYRVTIVAEAQRMRVTPAERVR
jgi:TonB family protein